MPLRGSGIPSEDLPGPSLIQTIPQAPKGRYGIAEGFSWPPIDFPPRAEYFHILRAAMPLNPGSKLGAYQILESIGAGGMGEVYVAEDPKLSRKVALKVLPPEMAAKPERLMRFEREAKAVAALNHPNIVTIHSVEEADGLHFLTMELVEGKTLSELIPKKGLPLNQFLDIAIALADAVAAAHQKGITHRDLKPDNMMVSNEGRLKILDFGLAKFKQEIAQEGVSELPTQSGTQESRILGTVAYMSPEQAAGKTVDHRTDIFSIGIILYQMLTGQRPFSGDTTTTLLSSIIKDTPASVTEINPAVPRDLGRIIKRCLTKDPERRYQIAKDLRNKLEETKQEVVSGDAIVGAAPSGVKPAGWPKTLWAAGAVIALLAVAWIATRGPSHEAVLRLANPVQVTTAVGVEDYPSLSPDGRTLAYQSEQSGNLDVWVKQVGSGQPLNRTSDHTGRDCCPNWSPDGSEIAFVSERDGGGLFVMPALAGAARKVGTQYWPSRQVPQWSRDGTKLAYPVREEDENFMKVLPLRGGETERVPLPGQGTWRLNLVWSPDEDFVAYVDADGTGVEINQLLVLRTSDSDAFPVTDGRSKVWSPAWSPDGRTLFYVSNRGGSMDLWGQPMGTDGRPSGDPQPLTTGLVIRNIAFSEDGTKLAYSRGRRVANVWRVPILADRPATWDDAEQITSDQVLIDNLDLSPDGQSLLLVSDRTGNLDLWMMPVEGGEMRQLTTEPTPDWYPRWSPDGQEVAFYSYRSGNRDIWVMPVSGGTARQVTRDETEEASPTWSPDGRELAYESVRDGNVDIWAISVEGGEARRLTDHPARDARPTWSPDGKWLAFFSDRTGQIRLWRVPATGGEPEQLSERYSRDPRWSLDGKWIYFFSAQWRNIWELSVEDRAERSLTNLVGKRGGLSSDTLSTDGRYLYFLWRERLRRHMGDGRGPRMTH